MMPTTLITTSWDDGHPSDLRIADLLSKHQLSGTFYAPRRAERDTMTPAQLRQLSASFEIGAHTLGHTVLTEAANDCARSEIADSKAWVEAVTGKPCEMFCPPRGKFSRRHIAMVENAGYSGLRSVELMSLAYPHERCGVAIMPTTIQAYSHERPAYIRNAVKRGAIKSLLQVVLQRHEFDWTALAQAALFDAIERGGVFHLWGHAWEIDEYAQWRRLDEFLRFISDVARGAAILTNGQICARIRQTQA